MSSLAPSSVLVLLREKLSPVNGWRVGSTQTFGHTSVRSCAVVSLIALCQMEGMAILGQLNAWLTLNGWPDGQCVASLVGVHPGLPSAEVYLSHGLSELADFCLHTVLTV